MRVYKKILIGVAGLLVVVLFLVGAAWVMKFRLLATVLDISPPQYSKMAVEKDVKVPMRDGIALATDVFRPDAEGKFPAIVIRLPYGKNAARSAKIAGGMELKPALLFTQRGYALVIQDTRGRYGSEGSFYAFRNEGQDGEDMLLWLETQPWYNGSFGMIGGSYFGYTQWALAPSAGDRMKCMMPMIIASDIYNCMYRQGAFCLQSCGGWAVGVGTHVDGDGGKEDWDKGMKHLPLFEMDEAALRDVDFFNDWVTHSQNDDYWRQINYDDEVSRVQAPALLLTGWYDLFLGEQIKDYTRLKDGARGNGQRPRLVVGPWAHGSPEGDMDFGPEGGAKAMFKILLKECMDWNDVWIRGVGTLPEQPVRVFTMGRNAWQDADSWPLPGTQYVPYYLHSKGKANTKDGDGILDATVCAANEPTDHFIYDPENPVPTAGGCFLGPNMGCRDQKDVETRPDVLVYTSEPLKDPLEVTGPLQAILYASSSCVDTDFTVKLCDVSPDGKSLNIQEGIVRGRFRDPAAMAPLTPGEPYEFRIDLWATSHEFQPGHRIRVQVSSSDFPQFDRNLNTGNIPAFDTDMLKAEQTVLHDQTHASHILLPVIP